MVMFGNDLELAVVLCKLGFCCEFVARKDIEDNDKRKEYRNDIDDLESNGHTSRKRLDRIVRDMP